MQKLLNLICEYGIKSGVAVTHAHCRNTTCQIDMLLSFVVIKILSVTSDCKEGLLVIWLIEGEKMLLVKLKALFTRDPSVGLRFER